MENKNLLIEFVDNLNKGLKQIKTSSQEAATATGKYTLDELLFSTSLVRSQLNDDFYNFREKLTTEKAQELLNSKYLKFVEKSYQDILLIQNKIKESIGGN